MRPKVHDGRPLSIRMQAEVRTALEGLRSRLVPGVKLPLAEVVRAALARGAAVLECEVKR